MALTTRKLSDKHEKFLCDLFGGRPAPGSGNQWNKAMDGRQDFHDGAVAFAWDGKSTMGKSIGVTREMWAKAVEQAHQERPMLALRFYDGPQLNVDLDLVVISAHDLAELLEHECNQTE